MSVGRLDSFGAGLGWSGLTAMNGLGALAMPELAPIAVPSALATGYTAARNFQDSDKFAQAREMWLEQGRRMGWIQE